MLDLDGKPYYGATTDRRGNFVLELSPGAHTVTANAEALYDLHLFLKISEAGVNPDQLRLVVDPGRLCCKVADGASFPPLLSAPQPHYPPAAAATRSHGQVAIWLEINPDGSVAAANVESGHPLLKAVALAAARGCRFEPSDGPQRHARIIYLFTNFGDTLQPVVPRYSTPYIVEVISQDDRIY
jgi:TonB family protein